jgi:Sec-independent protein translocase protein TatA
MLNIGTGEIIFIAIAALLILGPAKLPEFARGIGKLMREFRRQTDEVRSTVEREFYRMDQELTEEPAALPQAAPDGVAHDGVAHDGVAHDGVAHGSSEPGMLEHGSAEHGSAEHGSAEHGSAEHGSAEHGSAEHGVPEHGFEHGPHEPASDENGLRHHGAHDVGLVQGVDPAGAPTQGAQGGAGESASHPVEPVAFEVERFPSQVTRGAPAGEPVSVSTPSSGERVATPAAQSDKVNG